MKRKLLFKFFSFNFSRFKYTLKEIEWLQAYRIP